MNIAKAISEQTYSSLIYSSVVGKIVLETEFHNGQAVTTLFVVYPDGLATEVGDLQEAFDALDI